MKKNYGILLCFVAIFTACEEEGTDLQLFFDLDPAGKVVNFDNKEGDKKILIFTNIENWTVSHDSDWCEVTRVENPMPAVPALLIVVDENTTQDIKRGVITITAPGIDDIIINVEQLGSGPALLLKNSLDLINLDINGGSSSMTVTSNIEYDIKLEPDVDWLEIIQVGDTEQSSTDIVDISFTISYSKNEKNADRNSRIQISPKDASLGVEPIVIPVAQIGLDLDEIYEEGDIKVNVASAIVIRGGENTDETVDNTFDGKNSTIYRSAGSPSSLPDSVIIEYTFEDLENGQTQFVDYIKLIQENDRTPNCIFSKGSIWIEDSKDNKWKIASEFEVDAGNNVLIRARIMNHNKIRLHLHYNSLDGFVSLAEFECFKRKDVDNRIEQAKDFFQDDVFSVLKPGVTIEDIEKIDNTIIYNLAKDIHSGTYSKEFRARNYTPTLGADEGRDLKIGSRSTIDNPTGIFLEQRRDHYIYISGLGKDKSVGLQIQDYGKDSNIEGYGGRGFTVYLEDGLNVVTTLSRDKWYHGNVYIKYTGNYGAADPNIDIHFLNGREVGFWDIRKGHTDEDWKRILKIAIETQKGYTGVVGGLMTDVLGERVQLMNTVGAFEKWCPNGISDIIGLHDQMLDIQYEMMGITKNNVIPTHRMLGVRSWGWNPNWNGTAASYPNNEALMLSREHMLNSIWVFPHEYGHGNQITGMDNAGWGEVTNNVYSMYTQWLMCDRNNMNLGGKFVRTGNDEKDALYGDYYNAYMNEAFVKNKLYLEHLGKLEGGIVGAEAFATLFPLWQLTLYFMIAGEGTTWHKPDFWADINWSAIDDHKTTDTHTDQYLNFMKRAITASNLDLTQFFVDLGLLRVSDRQIGDYGGPKRVNITQIMVDDIESFGSNMNQPESSVIKYISVNSIEAFRNKLAVTGVLNEGIDTMSKLNAIIVSHSVWKNAVAFETYNGDTLVDICIVGTGEIKNGNSTLVRFPAESTEIKAIAWDGTKTTVYKVE